MIPPEPEPEPPVPETTVYSYSATSIVPIGSTEGDVYNNVKDSNGNDCSVTVTIGGTDYVLKHLIVNYVPAFDMTNYYFCTANLSKCILASNASIGGTHPWYAYDSENDEMVAQVGDAYVKSCSPLDYFDVVESGDFDLVLRETKGDVRESDLDND